MAPKPPRIRLREAKPLQDYYNDGTGAQWNVARLIDDTKDLKPFDCPLAALNLGHEIWKGSDMLDLAFHVKKVIAADLNTPIIIAWDGNIADGRHRILKAIIKGERTIKAVRMYWKPKPDRTSG